MSKEVRRKIPADAIKIMREHLTRMKEIEDSMQLFIKGLAIGNKISDPFKFDLDSMEFVFNENEKSAVNK